MGSYDIAQVADKTGLTAHTLRYYEKEALVPEVPRDASGHRRYSDQHLRILNFVNALRATGMPIREIKRYLSMYSEGDSTHDERLALLVSHRDVVKQQLEATKKNLKVIELKIANYEQLGLK